MTTAARKVLSLFEKLSDKEQYELAVEVIRRSGALDYGELTDEALTEIAGETQRFIDEEDIARV